MSYIIFATGLKYQNNLQYTHTLIKQRNQFWHPGLGTTNMENWLGGQLCWLCVHLPAARHRCQMEQICNW